MIVCNIARMLTWFLYIVVFKTMYSHFRDYTFECNAKVQYIKQNVQYNALPKIHHFSHIKVSLNPKNNPIFTTKVGTHPKIQPKITYKSNVMSKISNTIYHT